MLQLCAFMAKRDSGKASPDIDPKRGITPRFFRGKNELGYTNL